MRTVQRSACALVVTFLGALGFLSAAVSASSQPWPQHTVRVIVPLPAGIAIDLLARLFAERLSGLWHQPVIVENRPGADGIPAVTEFVRARDNHTLLFSFAGIITINPVTNDKLPYDPRHDLVPLVSVADNFVGIAVTETLKVKSLDDFVQLARLQPGKLNWAATPGIPLYAFAALQNSAGINIVQSLSRLSIGASGCGRGAHPSGRYGCWFPATADAGGKN